MKKKIVLLFIVLLAVLSACGLSDEEVAATSAAETAAAASPTPTYTATPTLTPTLTPTPIPPTPTPTPLPDPDASAMLNWGALDLPSSFTSAPGSYMGIEVGAFAFSVPGKGFEIDGSFVFYNPGTGEFVFGYAVDLGTQANITLADEKIGRVLEDSNQTFDANGRKLILVNELDGASEIGDYSSGIKGAYRSSGGNKIIVENLDFRIGDVYASVFVKSLSGNSLTVSAVDVARVYANSLSYPIQYCKITHLAAVEGSDVPTFEYRAEGFYKREGRMIVVTGQYEKDGKIEEYPVIAMGFTGELTDDDGNLEDIFTFTDDFGVGFPEFLPEFTFKIRGYGSLCEASATVEWSAP